MTATPALVGQKPKHSSMPPACQCQRTATPRPHPLPDPRPGVEELEVEESGRAPASCGWPLLKGRAEARKPSLLPRHRHGGRRIRFRSRGLVEGGYTAASTDGSRSPVVILQQFLYLYVMSAYLRSAACSAA